jgi:hypothetical protein
MSWKKTRDGEWVVCGAASELRQAAKTYTALPVTSRSGQTKWVQIARVGRAFGDGLAYGYLATSAGRSASRSSEQCDECGRTGARHERTDSSGIAGLVCDRCSRLASHELSFA